MIALLGAPGVCCRIVCGRILYFQKIIDGWWENPPLNFKAWTTLDPPPPSFPFIPAGPLWAQNAAFFKGVFNQFAFSDSERLFRIL
jgi:hypothetical protein